MNSSLSSRERLHTLKDYCKAIRGAATASQALLLLLGSCAAGVVQGALAVKDMGERHVYQARADEGDPQAEFKLGDAWCCTVTKHGGDRRHSIYSNEKATEWLCRAAKQNYGPAQLELARIYAGRPFRYNVMKQVADRVLGAPTSLTVAFMWADIAQTNKVDGAAQLRTTLVAETPQAAQIEAGQLETKWQRAPCTWEAVIIQGRNIS